MATDTAGTATAQAIPGDIAKVGDAELTGYVEAIAPLVQQDSAAASAQLGEIVAEARHRGLSSIEAQASYLQARAEVNQGHLTPALQLIDRARELWVANGEMLQAWRTDLGRMHVLDDLGRHPEAIATGEALVDVLAAADLEEADLDQATWMRAAALENLGVAHGYIGDHARALGAYAAAEQAYRDLDMPEEVPRPLGNRGVELIALGRFHDALSALSAAAEGFSANDDRLFVGKCLAFAARAHLGLGDYLNAAAATQRATDYLAGQDATTEYARAQLVRAETLSSLNLLDEALDVYDTIVPQFSAAELEHDLADAAYGRGVVLARLDRPEEAETLLRRAAAIYEEVGAAPIAANALLARSELLEGQPAQTLVDEALHLLEPSGRTGELAAALVRKAQLLSSPIDANRCLEQADRVLGDTDIPAVRWRLSHERGRVLQRTGHSAEARSAFEEALAIIDASRSTVADEYQRQLFMAGRESVLEELIALDLEMGDVRAAYESTELARARTLMERLRGEVAVPMAAPSADDLDAIYTQLLRSPSRRAVDLRRTARRMERRHTAPGRRETQPARQPMSSVPEAVGSVVTYQLIGDEVMAFVHADEQLSVVRHLAAVGDIVNLSAQLDAQWRRFDDPGLAVRQHRHLLAATKDILQQLHLRLLAPIPELPAAPLMIIPCEPLGNVPFAALHNGVSHLVERVAISMAPSRSVAMHAAHRRRSLERLVAFGVADEHTPHVVAEARAVAAIAGADAELFIDAAATVDAFKEAAASTDVIHLACHGVHRPDSPQFSALKLGDRWLTAAEVARLRLDGQLVVLSACSSGRQLSPGTSDELIGLPRAFLAAGAGAVVVNLWPVDDASSQALMTAFHRTLGSDGPAAALRKAQLEVMNDNPHPYYWAPTVLFGAPLKKEQR